MNQLSLTFEADRLARRNDPGTSKQAAARVKEFGGGHAATILECLRLPEHKHGLTVDEIAKRTNLQSQQINKRTADLCSSGYIKRTGKTRLSASGRHETVWSVIP